MQDFFVRLADTSLDVRLAAALSLGDHLFGSAGTAPSAGTGKQHEQLEYCLKRLLRGVCSSRDGARHGFTVALCLVLRANCFPLATILPLLHALTLKNGSTTSQEERELYIGRLFGMHAVIQSGLVDTATDEQLEYICAEILKGFNAKTYLRKASTLAYIDLLGRFTDAEKHQTIINAFLKDGVTTIEHVWFGVRAATQCPEFPWATVLPGWRRASLLYHKNSSKLIQIIKTSHFDECGLHPCFQAIIDTLVSGRREHMQTIDQFWCMVEETMFSSTHDRKYLGFQLFLVILPTLKAQQVPLVFSPHFMRCLINSLSSKDTHLYKQARETTMQLSKIAQQNSLVALPLVMQLLGKNGHYKFDTITKTKTVESILTLLTTSGIEEFMKYLLSVFFEPAVILKEDLSPERVDNIRRWVLEQMALLVRTGKLEKNQGWLMQIVQFTIQFGFFNPTTSSADPNSLVRVLETPLSPSTTSFFRSTLLTNLGYLNSIILTKDGETTKSGQLWNGNSWAFEMLSIIDQYLADESLEQVLPLDDSILVEIKKAESAITTVRKEIVKSAQDSKKVGELQAFENLFSHVALLTYHDPKETIDLIQELVDCCDLMLLPKKASTRAASKKRKVVEAADEASEKPAAIEVLVDILIGFLAKPSTLLRSLATGVFKVFVHEMTPKAISLIFDVLNAQSGVQGAAELFEDEQEEEGETTEQDSEDSDDADNASDDDDMAPVDPELVKQVQQVIGDGNSDEELEDMDDQEMTVFDEKLAQIFQQRKQLKTQQKETKQHVLHFKLRVLDFIDIYVKTNSQSAFLMDLLDPLVALYKDTCTSVDQKVLHDKVKTILLTKLVKAKDVPKLESAERCLAMLQDLHSDVRLGASAQTANFYSSLSLFLVKLVSHANTPVEAPRPKRSKKETESAAAPQLPNEERVCQIYLESFVNFLTDKKSMVRAGLFTEVVDRYPQYAPQLLLRMLAILSSTPEIKAFPLVTALTIVCHFVKRLQVDGEDTASMERFSAVIKQLSEVFVQILGMIPGSPAQGPYQFSKDRVKTCFKDLLNIYRYTKKPLQVHFMLIQTFPELKNTWDSAKIMELATLVVADDKFKSMGSLANLVKQLSALTTN